MRACCTLPLAAAALLSAAAAPRAQEQEDDWYHRRPGPSLPQQLNGVIDSWPGGKAPERLDRVRDVFNYIRTCWRLAPRRLTYSGQELTVRLSFNRSGEIIGQPKITYYHSAGDPDERDVFVKSVMTTFQLCAPLPFSEALGGAVAGRPFTFHFRDTRPPRSSL
jgi:hypothetical protein